MRKNMKFLGGIFITIILTVVSISIGSIVPMHLISPGVFAMLIGMGLFPIVNKYQWTSNGINFVSKKVLRISIILMGITLSFSQVLNVGKYSLIVMTFTLFTAFGGGYIVGKIFDMNWKLSSLISAGTGICGGSAIAAISPTIEAEDIDVAYAISATFIFDIIMVILFPIMGKYFNMSDIGYGLWTGTAVNDTSSVVAAGYAFSDAAGRYSTIVKLTRTLSIVPIVMIFAYINQRLKSRETGIVGKIQKVSITKIFPWFILMFIGMVFIKSFLDTLVIKNTFLFINEDSVNNLAMIISKISKFAMVMALGAIGLKSNFKKLYKSGLKPMLHGFIISSLVVIVAFGVQYIMGQL